MKNINPSRMQGSKKIGTLASQEIENTAKEHEFHIRNGGKISALVLLESFIKMMQSGVSSYWHWAAAISSLTGKTVSKQAVFKRMNPAWVSCVKALVAQVVSQHSSVSFNGAIFKGFGRVWLQDSSSFHLPDALSEKFKGNMSRGRQKAVAKLNLVVDLLTGQCPVMRLDSYTLNEQALSATIMDIAKAGDLVIRDLGYFALGVFARMEAAKVFYLSRLRHGVTLFFPQGGEEAALPQLLKGKNIVDIELLCGANERLPVRLVAIKLDEQQTAERVRKARNDRDKRLNHSEDYYFLLGYVIFVTNVGEDIWTAGQVAGAYRCRWNIEILFKSWKSGLRSDARIPKAQKQTDRIEGYLYMLLLYLSWFHLLVFVPLKWAVYKETGRHLSIIKAACWAATHIDWFFTGCTEAMKREITYHCRYDKRKKRENALQKLEAFLQNPLG